MQLMLGLLVSLTSLFVLFVIFLFMRVQIAIDVATFLGVPGSRIVRQSTRVVIERFGKFFEIEKPGAFWYPPILYRVAKEVFIANKKIPLYQDKQGLAKKNLSDGSVTAVGAEVVFRIHKPDEGYGADDGKDLTGVYRAAYESEDYLQELEDIVDTVLSGHLTTIYPSVDDLLRVPVYEFWESGLIADIPVTPEIPATETTPAVLSIAENPIRKNADRSAKRIGIEILRIQVQDFKESDEAIRGREEVNLRKREADAAGFVSKRRAIETVGSLLEARAQSRGKTIKEITDEVDGNEELRRELAREAKDMIVRRMSLDGNALTDIRVEGAGGLEHSLLNMLAVWQRMSGGGQSKPQQAATSTPAPKQALDSSGSSQGGPWAKLEEQRDRVRAAQELHKQRMSRS